MTGFALLEVTSHLEDIGASHLPRVAKSFLDAAEGKTTDCPGVKGLNAAAMIKLRKWAATAENKTKQMAK